MKDTKNILILTLAVIIVLIFTCNSKPSNVKETIKHYRDTIRTTQVDTVLITKEHRGLTVYLHDTIILETTKDVPMYLDTFTSFIKDSLLDATIIVYSETRPFIDFRYTLKQLETTNTILIKDSTVVTRDIRKSFMSVGGMIVGSRNSFGVAPCVQYNHKKGLTYMVGYDIVGGNIHLGFTKKISFR